MAWRNPALYEQQNDDTLNSLFSKVRSLVCNEANKREVTVNINSDADYQRGLIGEAVSYC